MNSIFLKGDDMKKFWVLTIFLILSGRLSYVRAKTSEGTIKEKRQIQKEAKLTDVDEKLLKAVNSLNVDGVKKALSQGANPNASWSFSAAIGLPCGIGKADEDEDTCIEVMEILLNAGATISQRYAGSYMYGAIYNNQNGVVRLLLKNGVNPNGTHYGQETFMELAQQHSRQDIVDTLFAHGAKLISLQEALQLRLIEATEMGTLEDVHKVVQDGASPKLSTRLKKTALIELLMGTPDRNLLNTYAKVSYLMQEGADVNFEGKPINERIPYTALGVAVVFLPHRVESKDGYLYEMILNALIKAGANVSYQDSNSQKNTPLHLAVSEKNIIAVEILLAAGADTSACNWLGSPVHSAVSHIPILKKLIASGADLSISTKEGLLKGYTPLHNAVMGNYYTATELLLEAGANVNIKDENGKLPLHYAKSAEIIKLLKAHGAKKQN